MRAGWNLDQSEATMSNKEHVMEREAADMHAIDEAKELLMKAMGQQALEPCALSQQRKRRVNNSAII